MLLFVAMTNLSVSFYHKWLLGKLGTNEFADNRSLLAQCINGEQTCPLMDKSPDFKSAWRHVGSIFFSRFGLFAEFYTWVALLMIFFPCWTYDDKGEPYDDGVMVTHFDMSQMSQPKSNTIAETMVHRLITLRRRHGMIASNAPTNTPISIGTDYIEELLQKGENLILLAYERGGLHGMPVCRTDIDNVIHEIGGTYKQTHVNKIKNGVTGKKSIFVSLLCGVKSGTKLIGYLRDSLKYEFVFLEAVDAPLVYTGKIKLG